MRNFKNFTGASVFNSVVLLHLGSLDLAHHFLHTLPPVLLLHLPGNFFKIRISSVASSISCFDLSHFNVGANISVATGFAQIKSCFQQLQCKLLTLFHNYKNLFEAMWLELVDPLWCR